MAIQDLIELDTKDTKHLCIIGDALTDIWIHGHLAKSQDGCDKFIEEKRIVTLGGAANAKNCLSDWNVNVSLFCQELRGTKTRYIVDNKIVFRHDRERECTHRYLPNITKFDAILLCDYDKGYLESNYIQEIIQRANSCCIPCVVDVKRPIELYKGAITKGNCEYKGKLDIITRGSASPIVNGIAQEELPTVICINHVGAGDCFSAHLILALAHGFSLLEAAYMANAAGRIYVQYPHNRYPRRQEIVYGTAQ